MRFNGYDYSQEGAYFITICCKDRACLFGEIKNREMILNANGIIAYNEWLQTTKIRSNVELDVFVIMPNHIHGIVIINNHEIDDRRGVLHTPGLLMNHRGNKSDVLHTSDSALHASNSILHTPGSALGTPGSVSGTPGSALDTPGSVLGTPGTVLHTSDSIKGVCNTPLQKTDGRDMGVCDTPLRSPSNTIGAIVRGYKSAVTKQINILDSGNYNQSSIVWQRSYHEHIIRDEKSYQHISNYIINNPRKWGEDIFYKE